MDPFLINRELQHHEYWRARLLSEFPEVDEQTLRDSLEGLTNLTDILASVVQSYLDDLTFAEALNLALTNMQIRRARYEARAAKKRALVTSVMEQAHLQQLVRPEFTVSARRTSPPIIITDEKQIPPNWWKPQEPKLDRQGLLTALRAGALVPGVALGEGHLTISVRTT